MKALRKQKDRLQRRQSAYYAFTSSMSLDERRGYKLPGSMNKHKGGGKSKKRGT